VISNDRVKPVNEPLDQDALQYGSMMPEKPKTVRSSEWLADMVERWRNAEKHWRKQASARERSYSGQPIYEDGLAEAFGRCANILANEMSRNMKGKP